MVGESVARAVATAFFVAQSTLIGGLWWPATRGRTCPLVRWQRSTVRPGSTRRAGDEEALMRYSVVYEQGDTSWGAYVPDLPGCVAVGESRQEVEALIIEAIGVYLDDLREAGEPIPEPRSATGLVEVA